MESLPIGSEIKPSVDGNRLFELLLRANAVTGATMAFRSTFRDLVLPLPRTWIHDAWIALLISAVAECRATAEPLITYRQHARQQIGAWRFSLAGIARQVWRRKRKAIDLRGVAAELEARLTQFEAACSCPLAPERMLKLREKAEHIEARARLRAAPWTRVPWIVAELHKGRYRAYSLGWWTTLLKTY